MLEQRGGGGGGGGGGGSGRGEGRGEEGGGQCMKFYRVHRIMLRNSIPVPHQVWVSG